MTGFYGWYVWSITKRQHNTVTEILRNSHCDNLITTVSIVIVSLGLGYFISHIHEYLPKYFPEPAAFPYLDAITTVMSFAAQALMIMRRLESWYLWMTVDVVGIGPYYARGVKLISLLYGIFLVLAIQGYLIWRRQLVKKTGQK